MIRFFKPLAVLFILLAGSNAWGQSALSPALANLPPSVKWQKINSEHFKVIFPKGFEKEANRFTNTLENIYVPASQSLGVRPRKFPIVLQNRMALSNGFVTIAPYRSEMYTFAPQHYTAVGNDDWMAHLVSHEYRHMVQFEKAVSKFNKFMYLLFGEYGAGFAASISVPSWFFEGDAVGVETAMGRSGRGRTPSFLMPFKANLIEKGGFNYYKQHLKSFRDFVPNHYVTGYLMTTDLKNEYGADIWDKITHQAFGHPYIPFTFSNSIKKHTGSYLVASYQSMMERQKKLYTDQISKVKPTSFQQLSPRINKTYTNYLFPNEMENGEIMAVKVGMGDIYKLVSIGTDGQEKNLKTLGVFKNNGYLSANDSVVVWIESEYDPRWFRQTYSVIKKMNIHDRKIIRLTEKSRFSAVSISPNGKFMIATHQSENSEHRLYLLNAQNGEILKIYDNPQNAFYSMPTIDSDNRHIAVLKQVEDGQQIIRKSIETGQEEALLFVNEEIIGHPIIRGPYLFYNSTFNGIDNIYGFNIDTRESFQVTNSVYGSFNPAVSRDGKKLLYNEYTVNGMNVVSTVFDPEKWLSKREVEYVGFDFQKTMVENEGIQDHLYTENQKEYEVEKYHKLGKSIRPVSWGIGVDPFTNEYIAGIISQDILSTTSMSALVRYNSNERTWKYTADISYQALYPIIDAGGGIANRSVRLLQQGDTLRAYGWKENTFRLGLRVPLLLTNSKYSKSLSFGSSAGVGSLENYVMSTNQDFPTNGNLFTLSSFLNFGRILRRSQLDVDTRWGQSFVLNLKQTPFGGDYQSTLFTGQGNFYFPGLFKHQSIKLQGKYQYQTNENYYHSSPIRYARGYTYTPFEKYTGLSANYKLPLAYMDFHVGPFINVQRIYTNLFYDYAMGSTSEISDKTLKSYGAEVSFNFNLMRFLLLFDVGLRYSYRPDRSTGFMEIIIGAATL